ncbi:hypothetical protein ACOTVJ_07405 [Aliarcobacter butzleri]
MKINKYWLGFFLVKLFYMFFALFIYDKITKLGDTDRWMDGNIENFDYIILLDSSKNVDFFGGLSSLLLGSTLGNLPFMILALYGIFYSVSKLELTKKQLIILLFLLSLPSFGVWSSVAGKEAIGVFFMGIILGYIIDILENNRFKPKFIELIAFYLMFLFKVQYSIAIFSLIIYIYLSRKFGLKGYGKFFLMLFHIILAIIGFYIFKDIINELSFVMPKHFSLDASSTRENTIWINDYDIFFNAPYGMFIAFWGPTLDEILTKPLQSIVFIESLIIFSFFLYFLFVLMKNSLKTFKINIFLLSLVSIILFWLLFVHYPFGVLNPGSALRYRENFYGFLVVFLFYLYNKYLLRRML